MSEKKETQVTSAAFGKVPVIEKSAYAVASAGGNIINMVLGTFLSGYLTDSVGIAAAAVGTMMLVARVFDAISDVCMGTIIDRTKTKWGKARPWLLVSAPLIALGTILVFAVPASLGDAAKLVYAYATYIFLNCICYTMFMVSHTAMLARISLNGQERQSMTALNQIINQIGSLAVTTFMVAVVAVVGWTGAAAIYGIAAGACILFGFFFTREHIGAAADPEGDLKKEETVPIKVALPAMLKNKYFYMLTILFVCILAHTAGSGSMTYYYCSVVLNNLDMVSFISACGVVPGMIINLFVPALTKKFGRRNTLFVSSVCLCLSYLMVGLAGTNVALVCVAMILRGTAGGPVFSCSFALASDVVDYGEWKTGIRSEGLLNSCVSFGQKVGLGIGPALATWIMAFGGYDGTAAVQTTAAVNSILFAFGYLGAIFAGIMAVIAFFMNLDKYKPEIEAALAKKHVGV